MKHNKAMMQTAIIWSEESYCKKKKVGAVVAKDNDPIAVGFNGTISGLDNQCEELVSFDSIEAMKEYKSLEPKNVIKCKKCDGVGYQGGYHALHDSPQCSKCNGVGHLKVTDITNRYTLHAEFNAITRAAKHADLEGASIYITLAPCEACASLIAAHKIKHVYYKEAYKEEGIELLKKCKINVQQLDS